VVRRRGLGYGGDGWRRKKEDKHMTCGAHRYRGSF
jgi:hypothetical protein